MLSSKASAIYPQSHRPYQEMIDNQDWRLDNGSERNDRQMWWNMNNQQQPQQQLQQQLPQPQQQQQPQQQFPNGTTSNNNNYHYGDQLYSFVNGRSINDIKNSPIVPENNMHQPNNNNNQFYQLSNNVYSNNTSFNGIDLPVAMPLQPLLMPQISQVEMQHPEMTYARSNTSFRSSRSNSIASNSPIYNHHTNVSSNKSASSASSYTTSTNNEPGFKKKSRRSRLGCLACRHRKRRCCETKPRCTECLRLGLNCTWPIPGTEHKNRSKNNRISHDEMYHSVYGNIKILRGVVEYKINE